MDDETQNLLALGAIFGEAVSEIILETVKVCNVHAIQGLRIISKAVPLAPFEHDVVVSCNVAHRHNPPARHSASPLVYSFCYTCGT